MTNQELGIDVKTIVEDALSGIQDLINKLTDVPDVKSTVSVEDDASGAIDGITSASHDAATGLDDMGTAAGGAGGQVTADMSAAAESVGDVKTAADNASGGIEGVGEASTTASGTAVDSFNEIAIALGLLTAGTLDAQNQMYEHANSVDLLGNYAGMTNDQMKGLVATTATAKFPVKDVEDYTKILGQLGVPNELLGKNAEAMNHIVLGTGSATSTGIQFAKVIKEMGGRCK